MIAQDVLRLTLSTIRAHRLRTFLTMLGIAIGTASVILLTSIGEGLRAFVLEQFTQFGTQLLTVVPGKSETFGMAIASTTRKLTIEDAQSLLKIPGIVKVTPVSFGNARVEAGNRGRAVFIYGVTADAEDVWKFRARQGSFLPPGDPLRGGALAVLGTRVKSEIFGERNPLGQHVRIGGRRFLVIGVMEPKGQLLGFDLNDAAYIYTATAMDLFNQDGLMEIDVLFSDSSKAEHIARAVKKTLMERHDREEDFTVITETEMLGTLDKILNILTMGVSAIAAISLLVGAIGILTMMWISVNERINEIGLEKAIGAEKGQILALFLSEAATLSVLGGVAGVVFGLLVAQLLGFLFPGLPVRVPATYVVLSLVVSVLVGLASGLLPARRAAGLDPVEALRAE